MPKLSSLQKLIHQTFGKQPRLSKRRRRILQSERVTEPLEARRLLTINVSPTANGVNFENTLFDNSDLHLRAVSGVLEYSFDGRTFLRDIDPSTTGVQTLTLSNASVVKTDIDGTTYIRNMGRAGGAFVSLGNLEIATNALISTRTGRDANSIQFQAPHIKVNNGASILADASGAFQSGDVRLIAESGFDLTLLSATPVFNLRNADASIEVGDATIRGRNVDLNSTATTIKYAEYDINTAALDGIIGQQITQLRNFEGTTLQFAPSSTGDTITRSGLPGSWIQDGFEAGMMISIEGSLNNNGVYRVATVTADTLTLVHRNRLLSETRIGVKVTRALASLTGSPTLTFQNNGGIPLPPQQLGLPVLPDSPGSPDKIIRNSGSWIEDGFREGQRISVEWAGDNDGDYTIIGVSDLELTLAESGFLDDSVVTIGGTLTANPQLQFHNFSEGRQVVEMADPDGNTELSFSGSQITRSIGNWATDGFSTGMLINVSGTQDNDELYEVVTVSPTTLTVRGTDVFTNEAQVTGVEIAEWQIHDGISRNAGSWIADGFKAGQSIAVEGTTSNDGIYTIFAVTDNVLLLDDTAELTNESPATAISLRSQGPQIVQLYTELAPGQIPLTPKNRQGQDVDAFGVPIPIGGTLQTISSDDMYNNMLVQSMQLQAFDDYIVPVQAAVALSNSRITIGNGAEIVATEDVTIRSRAHSDVSVKGPTIGPLGIMVGVSEAESEAILQQGAKVTAGDTFNLESESKNDLSVQAKTIAGQVVKRVLERSLNTTSALSPSGVLPIKPNAQMLKYPLLITQLPTLMMSYGRGRSESEAGIDLGAEVTANTAFVDAHNLNNFGIGAGSKIIRPLKNMGTAITVAVSDVGSDVLSRVDGKLTTTGDAAVQATALNITNSTDSKAKVKSKVPLQGPAQAVAKKAGGAGKFSQLNAMAGEEQAGQFGLSAGMAIAVSSNTAEARIGRPDAATGQGAAVQVGGQLHVESEATDNFTAVAAGGQQGDNKIALGGALNFSTHINDSVAYIGQNSRVDVRGKLIVESDAKIPNQITVDDTVLGLINYFENLHFNPPADVFSANSPNEFLANATALETYAMQHGTEATQAGMAPVALVKSLRKLTGIATTLTTATAKSKPIDKKAPPDASKLSMAGSAGIVVVLNDSSAFIGEGAQINQSAGFSGGISGQSVSVDSSAVIETVNVSGVGKLVGSPVSAGVSSPGSSLGLNLAFGLYDNHSNAWIADGANVTATDDVSVNSDNRVLAINLTKAGGQSSGHVGFTFNAGGVYVDSESHAWIENSAVIVSTAGNVNVDANTNTISVSYSMGFQRGGQAAVGATLAVAVYDSSTEALIGDVLTGTSTRAGSISADKDVHVDADAQQIAVNVSVAGAIAQNAKTPESEVAYPAKEGSEESKGKLAKIKSAKDSVATKIRNKTSSWKPGVSKATTTADASSSTGRGSRMLLGQQRVVGAGASDLAAASAITSAISANKAVFGIGVSGDVGFNLITNAVEAAIRGVVVHAGGDVIVTSNSDNVTAISTLALSVNKAGGKTSPKGASIAGSLAFDAVTRSNRALIENADVTARDVIVKADGSERHLNITAGGAGSRNGNLNVAGAVNIHTLVNETEATIDGSSVINASQDVLISGNNTVQLISVTGAVSVAVGGTGASISFGAGLDAGAIVNFTSATIGSQVDVEAGRNVRVLADNREDQISVAIGVGLSVKQGAGIAASAATALILTETVSSIADGADVSAIGSVLVDAENSTSAAIVAGAGAGGPKATVGVGVSVAPVGVYRTVEASIGENAVVTALGQSDPIADPAGDILERGVVVDASVDERVLVATASGTIAATASEAASLSPLVIVSETLAFIGDGASIQSPGGSVLVRADQDDLLALGAGALSAIRGSAGGGDGAALALAGMGKDVNAWIGDNASVIAGDDVVVSAESQDRAVAVTASGVFAGNITIEGSLGTFAFVTNTDSWIGEDADVSAADSVIVESLSEMQFVAAAGGAAIGSQNAGIGVSNVLLVHLDNTTATIHDRARVNAAGVEPNGGLERVVSTGKRASDNPFSAQVTRPVHGVAVVANSYEDMAAVAAGAAISGNVAFNGSGIETVLVENTLAEIGEDARINQGLASAAGDSSVIVEASDRTDFVYLAGSLAIGRSGVGIGVGAAIGAIVKDTTATISESAQVGAGRHVEVSANSDERLLGVAANAGFGSNAAVTGSLFAISPVVSTTAEIGNNASVDANGNVVVQSNSEFQTAFAAGNAAGSQNVAVGASNITLVHIDDVKASIGDNATVTARGLKGTSLVNDGTRSNPVDGPDTTEITGLAVVATSWEDTILAAVGGAFASGNVAVQGSLVDAGMYESTSATIGSSARINPLNDGGAQQDVRVFASDETTTNHAAGAVAVSSTVAVGASADIVVIVKETEATIGALSQTNAKDEVIAAAQSNETARSVVIAGGLSGEVSVSGAGNVYSLTTTTSALVDQGAKIRSGRLFVNADGHANILLTAGDVAATVGAVGVGASATTFVHVDTVSAEIAENADIEVTGSVEVSADSSETVSNVTLGAAGAQNAAIAGSANLNTLVETTRARIDDAAVVKAAQNVIVTADDRTLLVGAAGAAAVAVTIDGGASVGAAADVGVLKKTTEAIIDDNAVVTAGRNVLVGANSEQDVVSASVTGSIPAGIAIGIAGSAGLHALVLDTTARVGRKSRVRADGSIVITADDETDIDQIEGSAVVGLGGGGASIAGLTVVKNVTATVDNEAEVNALGNQTAIDAPNGTLRTSYSSYLPDEIKLPGLPAIQLPNFDVSGFLDPALTQNRKVSQGTEQLRGLSVSATSQNRADKKLLGGGISGFTAALVGSLNVIHDTTTAEIGTAAKINQDTANANAEQDVRVAAASDFFGMSVAGSASSFGASIDAHLLFSDTSASIGNSAIVNAKDEIRVTSTATEKTLSGTASGAIASAYPGLAGAVSVVSVDAETHATVGNDATLTAGRVVNLKANDVSDVDLFAGGAGFGYQGTAIGASIGASFLTKDTVASLGQRVLVNSAALNVTADSSEDVFTVAVAGAAGLQGGSALTGAATVEVIDSDTRAFIGENSELRLTTGAANANSLVVTANNETSIFSLAGAISVTDFSGAALAGGVDVAIIRNDVQAGIGNGAKVNASGHVIVDANSEKDVRTFAVSAAGGSTGISGAVAVLQLGGNFSSDGSQQIKARNGSSNSTEKYVDGELTVDQFNGLLSAYSTEDRNGASDDTPDNTQLQGDAIHEIRDTVAENELNNPMTGAVRSTVAPSGVTAFIGDNVQITAASVTLDADEDLDHDQIIGGLAISSGLGAGISVGVADVASHVDTHVGSNSTITSTGPIQLTSTFVEDIKGTGFAGSIGAGISVGGQVLIYNDSSTQNASIGNATSVNTPGTIVVKADANQKVDAQSIGGAVAGQFAAGVAVARVEMDGATTTSIGNNARIGQTTAPNSLLLNATSNIDADARVLAISAGIGAAGQGNNAAAIVTPEVKSSTGIGSRITTAGTTTLRSQTNHDADASSQGYSLAGGLAVGVSISEANISPNVTATLGDNSIVTAPTVELSSLHNQGIAITNKATSEARASGGSLFLAGNGASAESDASAATRAATGKNARINATTLNITSVASNLTEAKGDGITVAGGVGVGVIMADASASGSTVATVGEGSILTVSGDTVISSSSSDRAETATTAATGGLVLAGNASVADSTSSPLVEASVGNSVRLTGGSLRVTSVGNGIADAYAQGIAVAAGVAVGVSKSDATSTPTVRSTLGNGVNITTQRSVLVDAAFNTTALDQNPTAQFPSNAEGNRAGWAAATVSAGGAIGVAAALTDIDVLSTVHSLIGESAVMNVGETLVLRSSGVTSSEGWGRGVAGGIAAVGAVVTTISNDTDGKAAIGDKGVIKVGQQLDVGVWQNVTTKNKSDAAAGGALAGTGAKADTSSTVNLTAQLGNESDISVGGTLYLSAVQRSSDTGTWTSEAVGRTGGVVTVGGSFASTSLNGKIETFVGDSSKLQVGGNAILNSTDSGVTRKSRATASQGSLIGIAGAESDTTIDLDVKSRIGNKANVTVAGNLEIDATSVVNAEARANTNVSSVVFSAGRAASDAFIQSDTVTEFGADSSVSATNIFVDASGTHNTLADSWGRGDGLISLAGSEANSVVLYSTLSKVGDRASLKASDALQLNAISSTVADLRAKIGAEGADVELASAAQATGTGYIAESSIRETDWELLKHPNDRSNKTENRYLIFEQGAPTFVEIGRDAKLEARTTELTATVARANVGREFETPGSLAAFPKESGGVDAIAVVDVGSALSFTRSLSRIANFVSAEVILQPGSDVTGFDNLLIRTDVPQQRSFSRSENDADGVDVVVGDLGSGKSESWAYNIQFSKSVVTAAEGSKVHTSGLVVEANVGTKNWFTEATDFSPDGVADDLREYRRGDVFNAVFWDASAEILRPAATLVVQPNGTFTAVNLNAQAVGNAIVVNGLGTSLTLGTAEFKSNNFTPSNGGQLIVRIFHSNFQSHDNEDDRAFYARTGHRVEKYGTFSFRQDVDRVQIENNSPRDLQIQSLDLATSQTNHTPSVKFTGFWGSSQLTAYAKPASTLLKRALDGNYLPTSPATWVTPYFYQIGSSHIDVGRGSMAIKVDRLMSDRDRVFINNRSGSNVLLGNIKLHGGTLDVINTNGSILPLAGTTIAAAAVDLESHNGDIGRPGAALQIVPQPGTADSFDYSVQARDRVVTRIAVPAGITKPMDLNVMTAGISIDSILAADATVSPVWNVGTSQSGTTGTTLTVERGDLKILEPLRSSGLVSVSIQNGSLLDATTTGMDIIAPSASINVSGAIGQSGNPLELQVSNLAAQSGAAGMFIANTGNLTTGRIVSAGRIDLNESGALAIRDVMQSGENIVINATGAVTQTIASPTIKSKDLSVTATSIGTATQPLHFDADTMVTRTNTANGPQFLRELNSVNVASNRSLNAGTATVTLAGGTFVMSGNSPSAVMVNSGATLGGRGVRQISGGLALQRSGVINITLAGNRLTPVAQYDQLQVRGIANLNRSQLNVTLASYTPAVGDRFTILTSTQPIVGQFAQRYVSANGIFFEVQYKTNSVELVRIPLAMTNQVRLIAEDTSTASRFKVGNLMLPTGLPVQVTLSGADASSFEVVGSELFLKAGTSLNVRTKSVYRASVVIDITSEGSGAEGQIDVQLTVVSIIPVIVPLAGPTVDQTPTIQWNVVPGATEYEVVINNISTGQNSIIQSTVTTNSFTPAADLGIGRYSVRVRAKTSTGRWSGFSQVSSISINTPVTIGTLAYRQAVSRPRVTWSAISGAVRYEIWVDNLTTGVQQIVRRADLTTTSWTATSDLPMGLYRVWIRAHAKDGALSAWSVAKDFLIVPAPRTTGPLTSTFERSPQFSWNSVPGAKDYTLLIRSASTGATLYELTQTATTFRPPTAFADGLLLWQVRANAISGEQSDFSRVIQLHIGGRPDLIGPTGTSSARPTFSWTAVTGAVRYELQVDRTDVAQSGVIRQSSLTSNSFTPSTNLAPGTYRFWVRAISRSGEVSVWSVEMVFTVASTEKEHPDGSELELLSLLDRHYLTVVESATPDRRQNHEPTPSSDESEDGNSGIGSNPVVQQMSLDKTADHPGFGDTNLRAEASAGHWALPEVAVIDELWTELADSLVLDNPTHSISNSFNQPR